MFKRYFFSALHDFACVRMYAGAQDIGKVISAKSTAIQNKLTEWRRHLHKHPELRNQEFKTAAYIAEQLQGLGLEIKTGIAKTGIRLSNYNETIKL